MTIYDGIEWQKGKMVTATVYDPPLEGLPHMAVVFVDGEPAHVEPCGSRDDGENLIVDALRELKIRDSN